MACYLLTWSFFLSSARCEISGSVLSGSEGARAGLFSASSSSWITITGDSLRGMQPRIWRAPRPVKCWFLSLWRLDAYCGSGSGI